MVWCLALLLTGVCYAAWSRKIDVHAEGGPLEIAQIACWGIIVVLMLAATARASNWRDRLSAVWLLTIGVLCSARELDLHEAVQHGVSWLPALHFRIDWVLDGSQSVWPKLFWGVVFALVGTGLVLPLLVMKTPTMKMLRAGDGPTWLLFIGIGLLGMGYVSDDIIGRGRIGVHYEVTQGMEEVFELGGVLSFLMAAWCEFRAPLSGRIARATGAALPVATDAAKSVVTAH